jgi:transcription-repair coupling factor (superfamily II helicase)
VQNIVLSQKSYPKIHLEGTSGSLDAILAAAIYQSNPQSTLIVQPDKEDALYFFNDLQNLFGFESPKIAYFPASIKRPYEYEEKENANIIQRAELLNRLNNSTETLLIVSYPEALAEKVVSKKTLVANTLRIKVEDTLDLNFVTELLVSYDFEKTDFVYEPGQFAIRGGIFDVYSYAADTPFRVELFGDEIESIRIFDTETQLSNKVMEAISIVPNIHEKLRFEETVPIFSFIPEKTILWIKDYVFTLDRVEDNLNRISEIYDSKKANGGDINLLFKPDHSFLAKKEFTDFLKIYPTIEFGRKSFLKETHKNSYSSK